MEFSALKLGVWGTDPSCHEVLRLMVQVEAEIEAAKNSEFPPIEDLWNNIYEDGLGAKLRPIEIGKPKIQL